MNLHDMPQTLAVLQRLRADSGDWRHVEDILTGILENLYEARLHLADWDQVEQLVLGACDVLHAQELGAVLIEGAAHA